MRYATWAVDFSENASEGTTPPQLNGAFMISPIQVAGYIAASEDISLLSQWDVLEITKETFLELALVVNPLATLSDGLLINPMPSDGGG